MSKKGMDNISLGFSIVNCMWGSMELMCWRTDGLALPGFEFKLFNEQVGNKGLMGNPWLIHRPLKILTLEEEGGIFEAKVQQGNGGPLGK